MRDRADYLQRAFLLLAFGLSFVSRTFAQPNRQQVEAQIQVQRAQGVVQNPGVAAAKIKDARVRSQKPAIIEMSAPMANLFARADEGINRQDWKLAIDSLQRIIDDPEGSLIPTHAGATPGGQLFEFTRRQAISRLAALPPVALSSYRVLYDGTAKGLFDRAKTARDLRGLREIVTRYPLTTYGDDAADQLAAWALEEGRATDAASLLLDIRLWMRDSDVPKERVLGKLAIAYAMLGMVDYANLTLEVLQQQLGDKEATPPWFPELKKLVLQQSNPDAPEFSSFPPTPPREPGSSGPLIPTLMPATPWHLSRA
ncbi:MAG: hypothetical protein AABZ47_17255, partial [Planctomycetota bacterium]